MYLMNLVLGDKPAGTDWGNTLAVFKMISNIV